MLGKRVKNLRLARGWTQKQLAFRAGVSQQLITKLENGLVVESRKLISFADAFGLTVEELSGEPSGNQVVGFVPKPKKKAVSEDARVVALWNRMDKVGKRHILHAMKGEIARTEASRPFRKAGV